MKQLLVTIGTLFVLLVTASQAWAATTFNGTVLGKNNLAVVGAKVEINICTIPPNAGACPVTNAAGKVEDSTYVITFNGTTGDKGGFSINTNTAKIGVGQVESLESNKQYRAQIRAEKNGKIAAASLSPIKFGQINPLTLKFSTLDNVNGTNDPNTGKPPTDTTAPQARGGSGGSPAGAGTADFKGGKTIEDVAERGKITTLADRLNPRKPEGKAIGDIWRILLNITNGVVILVFLVMGFATIFNVQVDTYGVKKALPNVIIAIILANFSLFITRMVVDVSNILIVSIVNNAGGAKGLVNGLVGSFIDGGFTTITNLLNGFASGTGFNAPTAIEAVVFVGAIYTAGGYLILGAVLLAAIAIIIPSIFILILAVLFYVRTYVILALAAVSPLAFIAFALPAGQALFRQWMTQLVRWAFLGPIAFFMIWLAIEFKKTFGEQFEFGIYLVALTFLYLAISLPFKMGGVITANVGKYLGKPLRQAGGFGARWYGRTGDVLSGAVSSKFGGRPITIGGLYRGWGANADRYYQRHVAKSSGAGEDIREMVASGAMGMLRPWEIGGRVKRGINILRTGERHQQAVQKQVASEAQQIAALSDDAVTKGLAEALQHNDHNKAAQYLLAKAMQGQNVQGDMDNLVAKGLHRRPEIAQALTMAQLESAKQGNLVVNQADGDGASRKARETFRRHNQNKPRNQLETISERFAKELEANPEFSELNQTRYDFIEDFASDELKSKYAKELEPFRTSIEVGAINQKSIENAKESIKDETANMTLEARFNLDQAFGQDFNMQAHGLLALNELKASDELKNLPPALQAEANQLLGRFSQQINLLQNRDQVNSWINRSRSVHWGGLNTPAPDEETSWAKSLKKTPEVMLGLKFNREQVVAQAKNEIRAINQEIADSVGNVQRYDMKTIINLQNDVKGKVSGNQLNEVNRQLYRLLRADESYQRPKELLEKYAKADQDVRSVLDRLST